MKQTFIFGLLLLLLATQSQAAVPVRTIGIGEPVQNNVAVSYNVRIKLERTDGTPVTGSVGLRGYWARNEQTGVIYDAPREENEFEGLPGGTYTFGAYPGNWEGAVSKTVTLTAGQVGPDGFIEITLVYWVE
jgi:hypothetical protein